MTPAARLGYWGCVVLMPQVSATAGGNSISTQRMEEKAALQCHPPSCLLVLSCGVQSYAPWDQRGCDVVLFELLPIFICLQWPGNESPLTMVRELFPSCLELQRHLDMSAVLP